VDDLASPERFLTRPQGSRRHFCRFGGCLRS
jgi:hypothetical protein